MAKQVKGISKLNKSVQRLRELALEVSENHSEDLKWYYEQTPEYLRTEEAGAFADHLKEVMAFLDEIEQLMPLNLDAL